MMPFVTFSGSQIKPSIFQDERQSKPGLSNGRWSGKACGRYSLDREVCWPQKSKLTRYKSGQHTVVSRLELLELLKPKKAKD